jgi:hypothetical protein
MPQQLCALPDSLGQFQPQEVWLLVAPQATMAPADAAQQAGDDVYGEQHLLRPPQLGSHTPYLSLRKIPS